MLEIKNINISFKNHVIENGSLQIYPHELTILTGDSGSGKTSLLNILGLLDQKSSYDYFLNQQEIDKQDKDFQRLSISYVFQDYNAIDDLSIKENFEVMYNIIGETYSKEKTLKLLEKVSIEKEKLNQKAKSLSGGEKQRFALALALVKKPQLLLLDEPTANLDEDNAFMIVKILQELKKENMMIVIASHHPDLYEGEHIYKIKDHQLIEKKNKESKDEIIERQNAKKFNYMKYSFLHIKRHSITYLLILIILSFSLVQVLSIFVENRDAVELANQSINEISQKDIMVKDMTTTMDEDLDPYYVNLYHPFDNQTLNQINNINHIEKVYPYFSIRYGFGGEYVLENNKITSATEETAKDCKKIEYLEENYIINKDGPGITFSTCDKNVKKSQCYIVDDSVNSGVFISSDIANVLGIKKLNHTKIKTLVPTVMGYGEQEGESRDDDGTLLKQFNIYPLYYCYRTMDLEIEGIFENSENSNLFTFNSNNTIMLDYQLMKTMNEQLMNNKKIKQLFKDSVDEKSFQYAYVSSTYCVQADNDSHVEEIANEIKSLNKPLYVKTAGTMKTLLTKEYMKYANQISFIPLIISVISMILFCLLYAYTLYGRKKEISYLQANGITKTKYLPVLDLIIISIIALPISYGGLQYHFSKTFTDYTISHQISSMIAGVIILILLSFLCFIITKLFYRKLDVIKELRSK